MMVNGMKNLEWKIRAWLGRRGERIRSCWTKGVGAKTRRDALLVLPFAKPYVEFNCPKIGSVTINVVPLNGFVIAAGEEILDVGAAPADAGRTIDDTTGDFGAVDTGRGP
jgi:hypothetical protein